MSGEGADGEWGEGRVAEGEEEGQADSALSAEPSTGLSPTTLGS